MKQDWIGSTVVWRHVHSMMGWFCWHSEKHHPTAKRHPSGMANIGFDPGRFSPLFPIENAHGTKEPMNLTYPILLKRSMNFSHGICWHLPFFSPGDLSGRCFHAIHRGAAAALERPFGHEGLRASSGGVLGDGDALIAAVALHLGPMKRALSRAWKGPNCHVMPLLEYHFNPFWI